MEHRLNSRRHFASRDNSPSLLMQKAVKVSSHHSPRPLDLGEKIERTSACRETSEDSSSSSSESHLTSRAFRISPEKWQALLTRRVPTFITIPSHQASNEAFCSDSSSVSSTSSSVNTSVQKKRTQVPNYNKHTTQHPSRSIWTRIFALRRLTSKVTYKQ